MAFQTFDVTTDPANGAPRVALLREKLAEQGLDGFLVPRADEHQGEYVPPVPNASAGSQALRDRLVQPLS